MKCNHRKKTRASNSKVVVSKSSAHNVNSPHLSNVFFFVVAQTKHIRYISICYTKRNHFSICISALFLCVAGIMLKSQRFDLEHFMWKHDDNSCVWFPFNLKWRHRDFVFSLSNVRECFVVIPFLEMLTCILDYAINKQTKRNVFCMRLLSYFILFYLDPIVSSSVASMLMHTHIQPHTNSFTNDNFENKCAIVKAY